MRVICRARFGHRVCAPLTSPAPINFAMRKEREQTQIITRFRERGATKSFNFHEVTFNVEKKTK